MAHGRMSRRWIIGLVAVVGLCPPVATHGQPSRKRFEIGVILHGGSYSPTVAGLRDGLRAAGLEEGKHWAFDVRETKGDVDAVDEIARDLVRQRVDILFTVAGSITQRALRATTDIPIVFAVGTDPVKLGLVQSLNRPGTRLTGVHFLLTDVTAKRLQFLKAMLPHARRVLTLYDGTNKGAVEAARLAREAGNALGIVVVERNVSSVDGPPEGAPGNQAW